MENDIKMYPKEVGWEGMDRINLAQDRHNGQAFVKEVMTLGVYGRLSLCCCVQILCNENVTRILTQIS
jgi:hypothetical protein